MKRTKVLTIDENTEFRTIGKVEIEEAYYYQKNCLDWTFYNERDYTSKVFDGRFNFLLVIFSLFTTAFLKIDNIEYRFFILGVGGIIIFLLCCSLFRALTRLVILVRILRNIHDKGATSVVFKEFDATKISRILPGTITVMILIQILMLLSIILGVIYNFYKLRG
jgi:hypothetical protein